MECRVKTAIDPLSAANPFRTVTTSDPHGIVLPFVAELNRTGKSRSTDKPLSTVLANGNHHAIVVVNNGQSKARPSTDAMPSVTTEMKHGIINPESLQSFLSYYNGCNGKGSQASHITEPTGVVSTIDRIALVNSPLKGGQGDLRKPTLEECTYRTIRPHEVHKAMAFGDDYVVLGNGKEKVKQLGNAVTPPVMKWIVSRCIESLS